MSIYLLIIIFILISIGLYFVLQSYFNPFTNSSTNSIRPMTTSSITTQPMTNSIRPMTTSSITVHPPTQPMTTQPMTSSITIHPTPTIIHSPSPIIQPTGTSVTTNNQAADAAVVEINRYRANYGLPPLIYDTSKNADADACAAYDAVHGYHSSMSAGLTKGASGQCECGGSTGAACVQLYEKEESVVQNPHSNNPICGQINCGHFCIILGSYKSMSSGTSGNFSTHNFYNGSPICSF